MVAKNKDDIVLYTLMVLYSIGKREEEEVDKEKLCCIYVDVIIFLIVNKSLCLLVSHING